MLKIGITSDVNLIPTSIQRNKGAQIVPKNVLKVVEENGALPITFPITSEKSIPELINLVDGIILTGGLDVSRDFYKNDSIPDDEITYRPRDVFEIKLIKKAVKDHKIILGLCRGEQVINVALGGTLYRNLNQLDNHPKIQHEQNEEGYLPTHYVDIKEHTKLFNSLQSKQFVNSRHHQAVKKLGNGLIASAYAKDGIIEAIENKDGSVQGIQWHPEDLWQKNRDQEKIFTDFIHRCDLQSKSVERSIN